MKDLAIFSLKFIFFYFSLFAETMIKYLQLYLFYPGNNQFKSGIKKVFGPNKSV